MQKSHSRTARRLSLILAVLLLFGAASAQTTVRFVIINYDSGVQAFWDDLVERFEAENPDVDIRVEAPPINEIRNRLVADVGANNAPDLAQVATGWMTDFAAADLLQDWETVFSNGFLDGLIQDLRVTGEFQGTLYGLPYLATSRAMFVNDSIFDAAGVEPPATWDEFLEIAPALTDAPDHYALALQGTGNEAFAAWFLYYLWSFGGDIYDSEGNLAIASPEGVAALEYLDTLVNELEVTNPDVISTDVPEQMTLFRTGKAATTISGPWLIGIMENEAPDVDFSVVPIPSGVESVTLGVTDSLVMFEGADTEEARRFVEFFMQDDNYLEYIQGRGMLPTTQSVSENDYFTSNEKLAVFTNLLSQVRFVPLTEEWPRVMDEGTKALQAVYLGRKTPEQALQDAVNAVESAR